MNADPKEIIRLHSVIEGRVQGVGYRYFVEENALRLNLVGWVRNRWNGCVETVAEGDREDLENFINLLRRGPRSAQVSNVSVQWSTATGEFTRFMIKMTA